MFDTRLRIEKHRPRSGQCHRFLAARGNSNDAKAQHDSYPPLPINQPTSLKSQEMSGLGCDSWMQECGIVAPTLLAPLPMLER